MDREAAIIRLRALEPSLRAVGLKALYLFGSVARGDAGPQSDLDLLFEVEPASRFSLLDQARLQLDLSAALDRGVDFVARDGLHRAVKSSAEADMVQIF